MAVEGELLSFEEFCEIYKETLAASGLSPHFLRALHHKLENEIFDAGDVFFLTHDEEKGLKAVTSTEDGVSVSDPNMVFLIDHAWTYSQNNVRKQLCETPGLIQRLAELMGYSVHGECFNPDDDIVNNIVKDLWKYNQTYSVSQNVNNEHQSLWYVLDEFGSRIHHSDEPTVAVVPFFYQPKQVSFSIMWPLTDLEYGDELTRDYALYEKDPVLRQCRLLPWQPADLTDLPSEPALISDKKYEDRFQYAKETLPDASNCLPLDKKRVKLHMEILQHLITDFETFELVGSVEEADIVFYSGCVKDMKKLSEKYPQKLFNIFPCQTILHCKDFFADLGKRAPSSGEAKHWHPLTFNLLYELPQFVSHFQQRAKLSKDKNCWISKCWNLARGVGMQVTDDLNQIVRIREESVPRIVCKYVEEPVLLRRDDIECRVKFDFSFTVLMSSVNPLKLHVCKKFFLRVANKQFSLEHFDDYEKHFTVMNYVGDGGRLKNIRCEEFVGIFGEQYPEHQWEDVERRIHTAITQLFRTACSRPPPYGLGDYPNSRAIFSVDAILQWCKDDDTGFRSMQPVLFECNLVPDFTRACKYYPDFLDDAFRVLFLGHQSSNFADISDL
uniref:Tubulin--tyrosine ligase-like protein 12 n=1 Tax=Phallusia mammillata TaxID=59560 RepID=A0A6F9DWV7_9ASCI|nr:tubulin--tyrosine ligase-like protein 12 [Phallusia mammillata]